MKMTSLCLLRRAGSEMYFLTAKGQIQNMTSGHVSSAQVKVRSWPNRSIYAYLPKWLDEPSSHGTICASLSPSLLASYWQKGDCGLIWPDLASGDLPVNPSHQLHPDHHIWGDWPWACKNWMVSFGLCEAGSIFIFPHRLRMGSSRHCPDIRSPGYNFWDMRFMGTDDLKQACRFHTDPTWTRPLARLVHWGHVHPLRSWCNPWRSLYTPYGNGRFGGRDIVKFWSII